MGCSETSDCFILTILNKWDNNMQDPKMMLASDIKQSKYIYSPAHYKYDTKSSFIYDMNCKTFSHHLKWANLKQP